MTTIIILAAISAAVSFFVKKNYREAGLTVAVAALGLLATLLSGWGWTILFVFLFASFASGALQEVSPSGLIALAVAMLLIPLRLEWDGLIAIISWGLGLWAIVVSFIKD
ncbi:MAG: hypothetical protein IKK52_02190 [Alphaproteobacteria bacterium]|nr:hypothetical protein [Alphaproteobacteria bacterium]